MIELSADVNAQTTAGWTAFQYAVEAGLPYAVELLIKAKANLSIKNNAGLTSLAMAKQKKNSEIVALLTKAEAKE